MLREFYGHFNDLNPGMVGLEDCESLFTHRKKNEMATGKFPARHILSIQQAIGKKELGNAKWIRGTEKFAGGLSKLKSDFLPLLRLMESGSYNPGYLRRLRGVAFQ